MWLASATPSLTAELDAREIIASLKRPAPASMPFTEIRFSALLEQPLVARGELKYLAADHLERFVADPYKERTIIRGESVRVERHGEKLRTFSLNRAPELKGLLLAFSGLLTGEAASVERHFEITAVGNQDRWSLELTPLDARARKQMQGLTMIGTSDEPSCLLMHGAGGAHSVMLLGALADRAIDADTSVERLENLCKIGLIGLK